MKEKYRIITNEYDNQPHGIRDNSGFRVFFPKLTKYQGQDERYEKDTKQQRELAREITKFLNNYEKL